jgi:glycosyltransferase involved in cell wall biosynthesis
MRVLHVVKTTDGAPWAAQQAAELTKLGMEVHVALPTPEGLCRHEWEKAGAIMHIVPLDFPMRRPWHWQATRKRARRLVDEVKPDIIHSHFVGTTLTLRWALGKNHPVPRVFQIPGPLHLESNLFRNAELASAGASDYWIPSSRYIASLLKEAGIEATRQYLSYYGWNMNLSNVDRTNILRQQLGIAPDQLVVGNVSWLYPPKRYLGHSVGLKCHEDMIDALALVTRKRKDVVGVLIGGPYRGASWYEQKLRNRANKAAPDRIRMTGHLPSSMIRDCWPDFDCAIHVPLSENCGGVMEPLLATVPTIASNVGGLPEVVLNGVTGKIVPPRRPDVLANAILEVLENLKLFQQMARAGRERVLEMFDVGNTAREVHAIYGRILGASA